VNNRHDRNGKDRRYLIHRELSGDASEREDSWTLVFEGFTGRWVVEHSWRFIVPSSGTSIASGKGRLPIDAFEMTEPGQRLQGQLRQALRSAERDA
jgi:hypothetical protein